MNTEDFSKTFSIRSFLPSYSSNPRAAYIQKGECKLSMGKRGSETGSFTWPRSVAVGPDGSVVVADSSNHRVQVFDSNGRFLHAFGKQGSGDGELDNPAGVAVNRIGQIIVSDRLVRALRYQPDPKGLTNRGWQ